MTRFPWAVSVEVDPFGGESDIYVGSPDRRDELKDYSLTHSRADAAHVYSRDDADLIVRAVNLHDELVSALQAVFRQTVTLKGTPDLNCQRMMATVLAKAAAKP